MAQVIAVATSHRDIHLTTFDRFVCSCERRSEHQELHLTICTHECFRNEQEG